MIQSKVTFESQFQYTKVNLKSSNRHIVSLPKHCMNHRDMIHMTDESLDIETEDILEGNRYVEMKRKSANEKESEEVRSAVNIWLTLVNRGYI